MHEDRTLFGQGRYPDTGPLAVLARLSFLVAVVAIVIAVFLPPWMVPRFVRSHYLEHFAACYVALLMALAAMPRTQLRRIAIGFGVFATVLEGSQKIFQAKGPVIIFPSSGTGAWEAAIVNTLSPGDKVLMVETGHFATLWRQMAGRFGIDVDFVPGDWRRGADPAVIEARLADDTARAIKAGARSPIGEPLDQGRSLLAGREMDDRRARLRPADGRNRADRVRGRRPAERD